MRSSRECRGKMVDGNGDGDGKKKGNVGDVYFGEVREARTLLEKVLFWRVEATNEFELGEVLRDPAGDAVGSEAKDAELGEAGECVSNVSSDVVKVEATEVVEGELKK
ncbi:hypothetical protein Syun_018741 [Stephania yunnanensis]|uniref:Uncharacterized protein n=1 Tax=Stephania yunnanensis TaxID=152371 RepID=A0AAP0ISU2_9MAGN